MKYFLICLALPAALLTGCGGGSMASNSMEQIAADRAEADKAISIMPPAVAPVVVTVKTEINPNAAEVTK